MPPYPHVYCEREKNWRHQDAESAQVPLTQSTQTETDGTLLSEEITVHTESLDFLNSGTSHQDESHDLQVACQMSELNAFVVFSPAFPIFSW